MENVLYNYDLFSHIISFLPTIYHVNLHKICKSIRKISPIIKCNICSTPNIFIPICESEKLYCFDCYDKENIIKNCKWYLNKSHKKLWTYIEKSKIKKYVHCRYCNIKCASYDYAQYHLIFKCDNYITKTLCFIDD